MNLTLRTKRILKKAIIILLLFLYIYNPMIRFFPFDSGVVISFFILFFFMIKGMPKLLFFFQNKYVFTFFVSGFLIVLYAIILALFSGYKYSQFRYPIMYFRYFFELPIVTIAIVYLLNLFKIDTFDKLVGILIKISIIQSICVLIMLLSPAVRDFVFFDLLKFREGHDKIINIGDFSLRGFGLSGDYLFAFPLFQGICAVLILIYIKDSFFKYFFIFPLVLLSSIVNARVGITPLVMFIFLTVLINFFSLKKSKLKQVFRTVFVIFSLLVILVLIIQKFELNETFSWVINGYINVFGGETIASNASYNIVEKLVGNHLVFPNRVLDYFVGSGLVIFSNPYSFVKSDIGYLHLLFYGGMIFLTIIITSSNYLIIGVLKYLKKNDFKTKLFFLTIILTLLVVQIKGNIFNYNPFMKLFFLAVFFIIFRFHISVKSNFLHKTNRD